MAEPLILYSAATRLAYTIAQRYYHACHYVWCAPCPDPDRFGLLNPPSSDPIAIYRTYERDVQLGDTHSSAIASNRLGIIQGAIAKEMQSVIDPRVRTLIEVIVTRAPLSDFKPLLFVIPFYRVRDRTRLPEIDARARASSEEVIIDALPRDCFDVLDLSR